MSRQVAAISLAFIMLLTLMPLTLTIQAQSTSESAKTSVKNMSIRTAEVTITSIGNSTIVVIENGEAIELSARGFWCMITSDFVNRTVWAKAKDYISEGDATVVIASISRGGETRNLMLGLKQGDVILIKPILLKLWAERHVHTNRYLSVKGQIAYKGGNYLLIERNGLKALAVVGGKWVKAGAGNVTWEEVADEFKVGDTVRLFCHNILVMRQEFVEIFGINAFIWGYSGAIINLTSGTALSKA